MTQCRECGGPKPAGRGVVHCSDECRDVARKRSHRKHNAKRRGAIRAYKLAVGCQRCGFRESAVALDFHHIDAATKHFTISKNVAQSARVSAELAKCTVLCANCHRLTYTAGI